MKMDTLFDPVLDAHDIYMKNEGQCARERGIFPPEKFMKEYGTVHVGFGRQNGASSYIARSANERDLIFTHSRHDLETMKKRTEGFGICGCFDIRALADMSRTVELDDQKTFRNIWVDDASYAKPEELEFLYNTFSERTERFILVK